MSRTLVFWIFAAIAVVAMWSGPHAASVQCVNNECFAAASTSPAGLIVSVVLAVLVPLYPQIRRDAADFPAVTVSERVGAFIADFVVVMCVFAPAMALLLLLAEAAVTGSFQWSFARDFARAHDFAIMFPAALMMFAGLFSYLFVHALIGRQTVGQYVLGFRPERIPGANGSFMTNLALAALGSGAWPVSIYLAVRRKDKAFWWNLRSNVRIVRLAAG